MLKKNLSTLLFAMLFVNSGGLVGCASVEVPELRPHITLPGSGDGFWVNTLKEEEGEIKADAWKKYLEENPHIILFSPDWAKLRFTLLKNCFSMDCKNAVGALDNLFNMADAALKKKKKLTGK